jgi:hypothetical protein
VTTLDQLDKGLPVRTHGKIRAQPVPIHSELWLPSQHMPNKSNHGFRQHFADVGSLVSTEHPLNWLLILPIVPRIDSARLFNLAHQMR